MFGIVDTTLYLQPGHTYTLNIPTDLSNDGGFFPKQGKVMLENGNLEELVMGFCVEKPDIGTITPSDDKDQVEVYYKHKLPAENTIWFYAATGERVRMRTASLIVHDHSSIVTGGPAYATYFSNIDDSTEKG